MGQRIREQDDPLFFELGLGHSIELGHVHLGSIESRLSPAGIDPMPKPAPAAASRSRGATGSGAEASQKAPIYTRKSAAVAKRRL
jgi:hypothetical protein